MTAGWRTLAREVSRHQVSRMGTFRLTVTSDCLDMGELLHAHDLTCFRYVLDSAAFDSDDVTLMAWEAGAKTPGVFTVDIADWVMSLPGSTPGRPDPIPTSETDESYAAELLSLRCEQFDLPAVTCAHCTGAIGPTDEMEAMRALRKAAREAPRVAGAPGTCARCRAPYGPKTLVRRDRVVGGYRPACCWEGI